MNRQRDITDSIAIWSLILLVLVSTAYYFFTLFGVQVQDLQDVQIANGSLNVSVLNGLQHINPIPDFKHMDPVTKLLMGALIGLMMFLALTMGWVWWYKRPNRRK